MLKKTITYPDYNGTMRTEDFYFNLNKAELMEMELGTTGGLAESLQKMVSALDGPAIMAQFKSIILKSYGEKSADGKRFIKTEELSLAFSQTEAYSQLFTELMMGGDQAISDFIKGIIPADMADGMTTANIKSPAVIPAN